MSEYWVSHKKYFCKYCDIYIADDAPSRRQHESGLRHKGNRDRFVRTLYKQGERAKKDQEEEKREIARIEAVRNSTLSTPEIPLITSKAANAAFAHDVSSGHASAGSSSRSAKQDTAPAAKKPERPSSTFANYSTAESLGYTDPDEERLRAEEERRQSQGVVGEWEVVAPPPPPLPSEKQEGEREEGFVDGAGPRKRPAEALAEDSDDGRTFRLRKRTLGAGLDDIWDPGDIPIKLKLNKAESASPAPDGSKFDDSAVATGPGKGTDAAQSTEQSATSMPKWKPTGWKRAMPANSTDSTETKDGPEKEESKPGAGESTVKHEPEPEFTTPSLERQTEASHQAQQIADTEQTLSVKPEVKEEENSVALGQEPVGGLFKKRKLPSGVRGRR